MDPKASAKSKRSHSLHGRRAHHHPPAAAGTSHKKRGADDPQRQQQQQQQRARPPKPALPANWDRYDEEKDEEEQTSTSAAAAAIPKPKSKGADFSYLLEQARDTARSAPSFDDAVPDFIRGLSPFVLKRGKSLLLSCGDDNFVVDEELTPSFEVPFLSLDLHALGSQLENLKLSQRLFIDADYVDEELDTEQLDESRTAEALHEESPENLESQSLTALGHVTDESKSAEANKFFTCATGEYFVAPEMAGAGVSKASCLIGEAKSRSVLSSTEDHVAGEESHGSILLSDPKTTAVSMMDKSRVFEASTAEAELDMLLDSLSEIKLPSSSSTEKSSYDPVRQFEGYDFSASVDLLPLRQDAGTSSLPASEHIVRGNLVLESESPSSSFRSNKFASRNDVPTRHSAATSFVNDTIDDLLVQPSLVTSDLQGLSLPRQEAGRQAVNISQALDDLDSLLDGL